MAEGGDVVEVGDALDVSLASAATPSLRPAEKIARYNDIVADSMFSTTPPNTLKAKRFVNHVISDGHVPLLVSKQVMINFLAKLCDTQDAFDEDLSLHVLAQMEARVESYGKEIFLLRDYIAGHYEHGSDFSKAVDILTGADFESRIGILDNYNKFCKCLRIADLCLEIGDVSKAEPYIKNASTFLQSVDDPALILNYKCCNAVYLDLKIRLLEAATEYHEVSKTTQMQIGRIEINKEEMKEHLNSAVTCALLSAACPERSRVLSLLSQDKRCPSLKLYPVLQKVILGEFLNKEDASTLEKELSPHHKTPLSEGPTLLEKMMTEHNILCIYNANSSSLSLFSNMLAMDPHKVTNSSAIMSAAKVKTALSSVKHEIGNAHHTLQLEHNAYDAYKLPQPKRRLHLDIAQAHERAERGYSELSGTIENIVNEIKSELDAALNSLGSELEGIDLACSSAEF